MSNKEAKEVDVFNHSLRELMKTKAAKELITRILDFSGINTPVVGDRMAGRHEVGLEVLGMLQDADPTIYPRLIIENIENGS